MNITDLPVSRPAEDEEQATTFHVAASPLHKLPTIHEPPARESPATELPPGESVAPRAAATWRVDLALFLGMLIFLAVLGRIFHLSFAESPGSDHFVEQARAWLNGRLDVAGLAGHDFVTMNGRHYIVYPPLPALLMLPFVAVLGSHFSEVWFTWLVGATNVALTYRLLEALRRRGWTPRTQRENVVIAVTFGAGTIALWLALGGEVWFVAQTLAITGLLVMLYGAVTQRWWLASIGVGAAFLTRSPDVLGGLFVLVVFARAHGIGVPGNSRADGWWSRLRWRPTQWPTVRSLLALSGPFLIAGTIFVIRNKLYFGNFLDSGYGLQIAQDYPNITHGLLNWRYIWPNFVVDFLNFPSFVFHTPYDVMPGINLLQDGNGTSIFFTTPLFLLLFAPQGQTTRPWRRWTLWITVALLVGFSLVWNLTGWYQVGARYLFDAYPFLMVLLALRTEAITKRWLALATAGVLINIVLAGTFWCDQNTCLGSNLAARHVAFDAVLVGVVVVGVLAWRWLRQERHHAAVVRGQTPGAPYPLAAPRAQEE